jgi:hypothetical protein
MAKRPIAESKEAAEVVEQTTAQDLPVLTFAEAEVQKVADFVNYMYLNAEFKGAMKDYKKVNQMFADMHAHVQKIEKHIFEFKRISSYKKAAE